MFYTNVCCKHASVFRCIFHMAFRYSHSQAFCLVNKVHHCHVYKAVWTPPLQEHLTVFSETENDCDKHRDRDRDWKMGELSALPICIDNLHTMRLAQACSRWHNQTIHQPIKHTSVHLPVLSSINTWKLPRHSFLAVPSNRGTLVPTLLMTFKVTLKYSRPSRALLSLFIVSATWAVRLVLEIVGGGLAMTL